MPRPLQEKSGPITKECCVLMQPLLLYSVSVLGWAILVSLLATLIVGISAVRHPPRAMLLIQTHPHSLYRVDESTAIYVESSGLD